MSHNLLYCCLAIAALLPQSWSTIRADDAPPAQSEKPNVAKERIAGAFRFPGEHCVRTTGIAMVLDSHTLAFDDGTQVELNGASET